jgi:hypothetical protein
VKISAEATEKSKKRAKSVAAKQILKKLDDPSRNYAMAQWAVDELARLFPESHLEGDAEAIGHEHRQALNWTLGSLKFDVTGMGASAQQARRDGFVKLFQELEPEVPRLLAGLVLSSDAAVAPAKRRMQSGWAGEINSRHNAVVQRLRVETTWSMDVVPSGGYQCELKWRWADWAEGGTVKQATTVGCGASKIEAKAVAAEAILVEEGHMPRFSDDELELMRICKDAQEPSEAHSAALQLVRHAGPHVWAEALPYAWRVLLAAGHEEALFELVAGMETTPVPPHLWEQLLDECAPITRGRGLLALKLIEELRVLQLEAAAFPGEVEREAFHKWRHLLALERQGTFLHGIQSYDEEAKDDMILRRPMTIEVAAISHWPYLELEHQQDDRGVTRKLTEGAVVLCVPVHVAEEEAAEYLWSPGTFVGLVNRVKTKPSGEQQFVVKFLADRLYAGVSIGDVFVAYDIGIETPILRMISALRGLCQVKQPIWGEPPAPWEFSDAVRSLLLAADKAESRELAVQTGIRADFTDALPNAPWVLTHDQVEAVKSSTTKRLSLIQGPPGTGKTSTGVCIVAKWLECLPKGDKILAVADSNVAADNFADKLLQFGVRAIRVGDGGDERLQEDALSSYAEWSMYQRHRDDGESSRATSLRHKIMAKAIEDHDVVVATCIGTGMDLLATKFRVVVVDECSQATETAALCALGRGAETVVLIGDHKQLPATVLSSSAARGGLSRSLFERLIDARIVDPVVLVEQRRMHPTISSFPNRQFYRGQLIDRPEPHTVEPIPGFPWPEDCQVCFVDTSADSESGDLRFENKRGFSAFNSTEVRVIEDALRFMIGSGFVRPDQVGVLTPYAAQKVALSTALTPLGVCVDTVDGWQGMERDLIFFSATRSNAAGELGFVSDPRRMNVMLTRARRGLVVVGDRDTLCRSTRGHQDWAEWLLWVDEHNAAMSPVSLANAFAAQAVAAGVEPVHSQSSSAEAWVAVKSDQGIYYWEQNSGRTTWDKPSENVPEWAGSVH